MLSDAEWDEGLVASRSLHRAADTFFAKETNKHSQARKHKRRVAHQCTHCGKTDHHNLRACSLCKSARYCNEKCQLADYKARHKVECAEFAYPPLARSFLTEPVGDAKYPEHPIFARGHLKDVGCWVSIGGQADCSLQALAQPMRAMEEAEPDFHMQRAARGDGLSLGAKYKAFTRNLLTLTVLVQNRRKDKMKILVFPARTQLVSFGNTSSDVMKGRSEMDKLSTFKVKEHTLAVMGVAEDPWSKNRRVLLKNFNGVDIEEGKALPPSVHDAARGIVSLQTGEYVIFSAQFRLGDGDAITTDWEAFKHLSAASLAFTLWEQGTDPRLLDDILERFLGRDDHPPEGLRMQFDHPTMVDFYSDYLVHGEEAFIRSHYGAERVEILKKSSRMMELLGKGLTRQMEENMDMDTMIAQLRASGLQDMAEGLEECRRRTREG